MAIASLPPLFYQHQSNLPVLDSSSPPPSLFDGTTRLYISFISPFAQRAWCACNFKGLAQIEIIAINLGNDKPKWYTEVYPVGKVPALEDKGKVIGESLNILEYLDQNFEGPALYPQESAKKEAVKELVEDSDSFMKQVFELGMKQEATKSDVEEGLGPPLDHLEEALGKFEIEGPYFVGQFGAVDIVYAPLIERLELLMQDFFNYDIYTRRPRLQKWFQAMNTVDAFSSTRCDPQILVQYMQMYKKSMGR